MIAHWTTATASRPDGPELKGWNEAFYAFPVDVFCDEKGIAVHPQSMHKNLSAQAAERSLMVRTSLTTGLSRICLAMTAMLLVVSGCQAGDAGADGEATDEPATAEKNEWAYETAAAQPWRTVFEDDGTGDWQEQWFLDGDKARVLTGEDGMTLHAGPTPDDDASHAVLWTKQSFEGDAIKVEYDYTRRDTSNRGVNIIYVLATGEGGAPYVDDIYEWRELRRVPGMGRYFSHMNTYHISYAAGGYDEDGQETGKDYVRARRYMPEGRTLRGTALEPDYRDTGLFLEGVPHHIVVIKSGDRLFMEVSNPTQRRLFAWKTDALPNITEGRVGFRQMFTRSARYRNIQVCLLDD